MSDGDIIQRVDAEIVEDPDKSLELQKSIDSFSLPLSNYLNELGLPTEDVLYPISERRNVIVSLRDALDILPLEEREKASYLTKFTVAISVGLFDGALNYLWNETISALRRLVAKTDLQYFFSVLEKVDSSRYKNLSSADDLDAVADHDLLEVSRRIGLISDINYRRLENVNYMRNHASAAHPNDNEIDGFEILSWLRVCLRHAITAQPDHSVITLKQLLDNIRTESIPSEDFGAIGADLVKLPQERIDDFLWTIFGMYADPRQTIDTKRNIADLASYAWNAATEDRKFEVGAKYGSYRKNADVKRKESAKEFLGIVDGLSYRDEDSLTVELIEKIEKLRRAHFGANNFYNEYPYAMELSKAIPKNGVIPRAARNLWVKVISMCFIGNGLGYREGVDERALAYYKRYISQFTEAEIKTFLNLFKDSEFASTLDTRKTDSRVRKLAHSLKDNTNNIHIKNALDIVGKFPKGKLSNLAKSKEYTNTMSKVLSS